MTSSPICTSSLFPLVLPPSFSSCCVRWQAAILDYSFQALCSGSLQVIQWGPNKKRKERTGERREYFLPWQWCRHLSRAFPKKDAPSDNLVLPRLHQSPFPMAMHGIFSLLVGLSEPSLPRWQLCPSIYLCTHFEASHLLCKVPPSYGKVCPSHNSWSSYQKKWTQPRSFPSRPMRLIAQYYKAWSAATLIDFSLLLKRYYFSKYPMVSKFSITLLSH